jgi:glucose-6-phosphate isomerase
MQQSVDLNAPAQFALGQYQDTLSRALDDLRRVHAVVRLWARDGRLWCEDAQGVAEAEARLGWLDLPARTAAELAPMQNLAEQVRSEGFAHVVLLGMGGSSLAPEVMQHVLGRGAGYPALTVLDTTDPAEIRHAHARISLEKTLFVASSKSGSTAETLALYHYFRAVLQERVGQQWARHMVAIGDPGTGLEALARESGFRAFFPGRPDVGGRYSALSVFGLAPAALIGVDIARLLAGARALAEASAPGIPVEDNTSLVFGDALGELARTACLPHDKLTLLTSPRLAPFGAWAEQLIAESTGKRGMGIVPVEGEPARPADTYGRDRLFVYLRLRDDDNALTDQSANDLVAAGHPLISFCLADAYALGAEFWRWEFATAIAGQRLGVNPFDQPDVELAKRQARQALARLQHDERQTGPEPNLRADEVDVYGPFTARPQESVASYVGRFVDDLARLGDYVALMAYVERGEANAGPLARIRRCLGERTGLATTLGYGPRFLHSTGQLHKGGPNTGLYVQITQADDGDLAIPGQSYTFGVLKRAQAAGDLEALRMAGRRVLRLHLLEAGPAALAQVAGLLEHALC